MPRLVQKWVFHTYIHTDLSQTPKVSHELSSETSQRYSFRRCNDFQMEAEQKEWPAIDPKVRNIYSYYMIIWILWLSSELCFLRRSLFDISFSPTVSMRQCSVSWGTLIAKLRNKADYSIITAAWALFITSISCRLLPFTI